MCHTYHELLFSVSVYLSQKPKCLVQLKNKIRKDLLLIKEKQQPNFTVTA